MTHFHILSFSLEIVYIENIHKSWYTKWFYNALFCFLCKNPIILSCLLLMFRYQKVTGWRRDGARLKNTKFLALKTVQSFPCSGFNILAVPAPGPGPGPGLVYRPVPGPAPAWPCDIYIPAFQVITSPESEMDQSRLAGTHVELFWVFRISSV